MRYFMDTEFIENGITIDLISIGIVAEDGRELYAQNIECDFSKASEWVAENVFPSLTNFDLSGDWKPLTAGGHEDWYSRRAIATSLASFIHMPDPIVSIWGYYADYDWVVFCQLFGTMMDLPKGFPMYCRDLKQWADDLGNPKLPEQGKGEHNALADARWNKQVYDFLWNKDRG